MKLHLVTLLTVSLLACAGNVLNAQKADILPPNTRSDVVKKAKALAEKGTGDSAKVPENAVNPFDPTAGKAPEVVTADVAPVIAPSKVSDDVQLRKLAPSLQPTGTMLLGGEAYLLFGQKKLKVGESLPINFEGATYNVLLTDIQSTSYSIRLGSAEIVRPIKPVTRP